MSRESVSFFEEGTFFRRNVDKCTLLLDHLSYRRLIEEETEHSDVPGPIGIILFFLFLKNGFHTAMRIFNLAAARLCFAAHVDVEISFAILILYICIQL